MVELSETTGGKGEYFQKIARAAKDWTGAPNRSGVLARRAESRSAPCDALLPAPLGGDVARLYRRWSTGTFKYLKSLPAGGKRTQRPNASD